MQVEKQDKKFEDGEKIGSRGEIWDVNCAIWPRFRGPFQEANIRFYRCKAYNAAVSVIPVISRGRRGREEELVVESYMHRYNRCCLS